MAIWAIADLHLSFGVPNKGMEIFGSLWEGYTARLETAWRAAITDDDLVLLAGDLSWAMTLEEAAPDFAFVHALPGTKVLVKGNHDYWWGSLSKVQKALPPSMHVIQNNAFSWQGVAIAGSRLWDTEEFGFHAYIDFKENPRAKEKPTEDKAEQERIFERELLRLEASLKAMDKHAKTKIAMTHYPPISADLKESRCSKMLESYGISDCVFGHLHNLKEGAELFGEKNGVRYHLTAADYLRFVPVKII